MIIVSMGGMIIMFAFGDDGKERERRRWNGHSAINSIENNSKSMALRVTDRGESTDARVTGQTEASISYRIHKDSLDPRIPDIPQISSDGR